MAWLDRHPPLSPAQRERFTALVLACECAGVGFLFVPSTRTLWIDGPRGMLTECVPITSADTDVFVSYQLFRLRKLGGRSIEKPYIPLSKT